MHVELYIITFYKFSNLLNEMLLMQAVNKDECNVNFILFAQTLNFMQFFLQNIIFFIHFKSMRLFTYKI